MQKCHRTACVVQINKIWMHRQTKDYYCSSCAKAINMHNPGLIICTVYSQTDLLNVGRLVLEAAGLSDIDEERIAFFIKEIQISSSFKRVVQLSGDAARAAVKATPGYD